MLFPSTALKHLELHSSNHKITIAHKNFRHCRVRFTSFVRQPFSKQLYYGQTERSLKTRITEHKRAVFRCLFDHDSKISCHVHENNHEMDCETVRVLAHEANFHDRLLGSLVVQKGSAILKWPHRHPRGLCLWYTHKSRATLSWNFTRNFPQRAFDVLFFE